MSAALIILQQLGGGRFITMTGANSLTGSPNALSFKLPGGGGFTRQGINFVRITLDASDTYDVTFGRLRAGKLKLIAEHSFIYCDQLRSLFTSETGLQVSL